MPEKEVRVIQSVQRAIDIINCFDEHELKLTLPQISAKLELNINTVRGLVNIPGGQRLPGACGRWELLYAGTGLPAEGGPGRGQRH